VTIFLLFLLLIKLKGKALPVTVRGDSQGCEMSSLPRFVYSRLTDGGKPHATAALHSPQEDTWYSFLLEVESTSVPCRGFLSPFM
jgi:hypothetical protein